MQTKIMPVRAIEYQPLPNDSIERTVGSMMNIAVASERPVHTVVNGVDITVRSGENADAIVKHYHDESTRIYKRWERAQDRKEVLA